MTDNDLKKKMNVEWEKVRKKFYYPQVSPPILIEDNQMIGGSFDFNGLETIVDGTLVKFLSKKFPLSNKDPESTIIYSILSHELTHFIKYPGSFLDALNLQYAAKDLASSEKVTDLLKEFIEIQTNLDCIVKQDVPEYISLLKINHELGMFPGILGPLHYALYEKISGKKFGIKFEKDYESYCERLKEIDFLDKNKEVNNFRNFVEIMKSYEHLKNNLLSKGNQGNQNCKGSQSNSGNQGSQSNSGNQGNQSNSGNQGSQSNSGSQGNQENQSNSGNQGNQNCKGSQSNSGNQGSQSNSGSQGNQNCKGSQSNSGNQGSQSNSGSQGNQENQNGFYEAGTGRAEFVDQKKLMKSDVSQDINNYLNKGFLGNKKDIFSKFNLDDVKEGLKGFVKNCDIHQYEAFVDSVLKKYVQEKNKFSDKNSKGFSLEDLTTDYYSVLAENYKIPIKKKNLEKSGCLYPYSHSPFQISDSILDMDLFSTPGILPGITQKWIRKEGEFGNESSVPDSLIIMDNSGSMPNPNVRFASHVLGGVVIANSYLENGSKVAVYSFGSNDGFLDFTKDKKKIHKMLRAYAGGGTTFQSSFLKKKLENNWKKFDISIISDMEISNLPEFVNTFLQIPLTNRIHLFCTKGLLYNFFPGRENVAFLPLTHKGDIEKIVMGELKKSIK